MPIIIIKINEEDEKKLKLFGKHTIPGGQRGILINV
jgi:hypothetical protein